LRATYKVSDWYSGLLYAVGLHGQPKGKATKALALGLQQFFFWRQMKLYILYNPLAQGVLEELTGKQSYK
jgi:hypothetical protein